MLIVALLTFAAVMLAAGALFFWVTPTVTEQRLQAEPSPSVRRLDRNGRQAGGPVRPPVLPTAGSDATPLRLRFLNAGIRHENAPLLYFGAKTLLPLVMMFLVYSLMLAQGTTDSLQLLLYPLVTGLVACYLPNLVLRWMAARRKREIFENFPDAADLMLVCVEAGMGLDAALGKVTAEIRIKAKPWPRNFTGPTWKCAPAAPARNPCATWPPAPEWTRFTPSRPC
jgi:tight adherence protein C